MTIKQIYEKFQIPQNLQEHMLRVGALAKILTDNWTSPKIDSLAIVKAGLLHDIAKPITFDPTKQAQFGMSAIDIANLEKLQNFIRTKYSQNEHHATLKIAQDLGCKSTTIRAIDNSDWNLIPEIIKSNDLEAMILTYCDMRIGLNGILSLPKRVTELETRASGEDFVKHAHNGQALEKIISQNVSLDLNAINDQEINGLFAQLMLLDT